MPHAAAPEFVSIDDLRTRYPPHVVDVLAILDLRVQCCIARARAHPLWRAFTSPQSSDELVLGIVREIFRSVALYQRHTTEAGFLMLGRLPKGDQPLLRALFNHKVEEAEHGLWAVEDFERLGGRRSDVEGAPLTPATMAVAAVWWRMAQHEDPFGYLGAEYLFEMFTPIIAADAVAEFRRRGLRLEPIRFVVEHATEDIKHSNLMKYLICEYLGRYPDAGPSMIRCFDYFEQVYPFPVWTEALAAAFESQAAT
jgi:pyrroloquinoline quinone (PQQ) biosynthesis protein C